MDKQKGKEIAYTFSLVVMFLNIKSNEQKVFGEARNFLRNFLIKNINIQSQQIIQHTHKSKQQQNEPTQAGNNG